MGIWFYKFLFTLFFLQEYLQCHHRLIVTDIQAWRMAFLLHIFPKLDHHHNYVVAEATYRQCIGIIGIIIIHQTVISFSVEWHFGQHVRGIGVYHALLFICQHRETRHAVGLRRHTLSTCTSIHGVHIFIFHNNFHILTLCLVVSCTSYSWVNEWHHTRQGVREGEAYGTVVELVDQKVQLHSTVVKYVSQEEENVVLETLRS